MSKTVEEPERLSRFMNNRSSYSEDFKALVIKLAHESSVKEAAVQAGVSEQAIYAWLEAWNTKKKRGL